MKNKKKMKPDKGGWYLVYSQGNRFTSLDSDLGQRECEVFLKTTGIDNMEEAVAEAKEKWKKILNEKTAQWKRHIKEKCYPSTTAFGGILPEPRVIYKIKLFVVGDI